MSHFAVIGEAGPALTDGLVRERVHDAAWSLIAGCAVIPSEHLRTTSIEPPLIAR
jgi:hypothetical protein